MKIKNLICTFLCIMLVSMTAFATQPELENAADNATQETQIQPPEGGQMPPERNMPPEGDMMQRENMQGRGPGGGRGMRPDMFPDGENAENIPTENGEMPEDGFGGRDGMGRPMQDGTGENMQMPQQMQNGTQPQSTDGGNMNYSTLVSAAVLLVLGFIFVIFYKRRTF